MNKKELLIFILLSIIIREEKKTHNKLMKKNSLPVGIFGLKTKTVEVDGSYSIKSC